MALAGDSVSVVYTVSNALTSCHQRELRAKFPFLQQRLCAVTVAFLAQAAAALTAGTALSLSLNLSPFSHL